MPILRTALSLMGLSLVMGWSGIELHAEDNPFAHDANSEESAFPAYERIVDRVGEALGAIEDARTELSPKKDWLNHQIQSLRSKNGDDLKRLWLLHILEKSDDALGTNLPAYIRMDLASLDELVKDSYVGDYKRELELIRSASASQICYWWPVIRDISRPEIRQISKRVFQANGLYEKIYLYGEELDAIDDEESVLRADCRKLLRLLGPSMEQLFLKSEFSALSIIGQHSAIRFKEEEISNWLKKYDRYILKYDIGTYGRRLKFYHLFNPWLLEAKKAVYSLPPKAQIESLGERVSWQSIEEMRLSRNTKASAAPKELRAPIIMFSLPDIESMLTSSRYRRGPEQLKVQRAFLLKRSAFYKEELHRIYKRAAELGIYKPALNHTRTELGLVEDTKMAWAEINPKYISGAADILVPVDHLQSYFRPISTLLTRLEDEKFVNESLLGTLEAEITHGAEGAAGDIEGNKDLTVALSNEPNAYEEGAVDSEVLFEATTDLMSVYAAREPLANLKAILQMEKDLLEGTLSKRAQNSLERSRAARVRAKQSDMARARSSNRLESALETLHRRSRWLNRYGYRYRDEPQAFFSLITLEILEDVLRDVDREIDTSGEALRDAFRGHKVSLPLLAGLAEAGGVKPNSLEFYELFSVLVPFLDYESSDNGAILALLKDLQSNHELHKEAARGLEVELRNVFFHSGQTLMVDLIDIWRGLETFSSGFVISPGLDDLFSIDVKLQPLFYPDRRTLPQFVYDFSSHSNEAVLDAIITRGAQHHKSSKLKVPNSAPGAHEFLLNEAFKLRIGERQLYASQVAMLSASERDRYKNIWESDWVHELSLDIRDHTRLVLWLSLLSEEAVSDVKDSVRFVAEKKNALDPGFSRLATKQPSRRQVEEANFSDLRVKLNSDGRIRLPTADEIIENAGLIPPLKSILKYYSEEGMEQLTSNDRLKRASDNARADPVASIKRASVEEIRGLNEHILGLSFFEEARVALHFVEVREASKLSAKIMNKIGYELDRHIGKEDVEVFTWLQQNISAGLPNSSKLYWENLNRLGTEEIDAYLEGKVD